MADTAKTYAQSGVDYSAMDPIKVQAQQRAAATAPNLRNTNASEVVASRGESAYVWEEADAYRALVVEGLGTKNLVADAVRSFTNRSHYNTIAQDTVAMIVNDLVVVGAIPQVVNAYFAIGDSQWMKDEARAADLIEGWAEACQAIGATWGGGETPTLKGIVDPATIDLGGSAIGIINPKSNLVLGNRLEAGDAIVLIESSGIHANGITFVRHLAEQQPDIYQTELTSGQSFGEAILSPTHLYVSLVRELQKAAVPLSYMVNITGHGWRKLMRANADFTYRMTDIPKPQAEFDFMQDVAKVDDTEMYGNFNMGAGFAVYVPLNAAEDVVTIAKQQGLQAWVAGAVEAGPKRVIIEPLDITFESDSLAVRS